MKQQKSGDVAPYRSWIYCEKDRQPAQLDRINQGLRQLNDDYGGDICAFGTQSFPNYVD